jgi:hypothetical protein
MSYKAVLPRPSDFNVTDKDGNDASGKVFVLDPTNDPCALFALRVYAGIIQKENIELAEDLTLGLDEIDGLEADDRQANGLVELQRMMDKIEIKRREAQCSEPIPICDDRGSIVCGVIRDYSEPDGEVEGWDYWRFASMFEMIKAGYDGSEIMPTGIQDIPDHLDTDFKDVDNELPSGVNTREGHF